MTNKEHIEQQILGLSFALFEDNMNNLINEINNAVEKSETPAWREQLKRSFLLMQEIREKASEATIVVDGFERRPTIEEKIFNWLCATFRIVVHNHQ